MRRIKEVAPHHRDRAHAAGTPGDGQAHPRQAARRGGRPRVCHRHPRLRGGRLYVDRLLGAREHPEQAVRACLGVLRLAGTYGKERLELACERALAAGVASSRYVERLLKADRRHPFLDAHAEDGLGEHGNLRGPAYYN